MKCLYRINCGGRTRYTDTRGITWLPDQQPRPGRAWSVQGGGVTPREAELPVHDRVRPELYRSERHGNAVYQFALPDATYMVRLHFCETFESNYRAGLRLFDVRINGLRVLHEFDPFAAAGGFARPVMRAFRGMGAPDGALTIELGEGACLSAIELFAQSPRPAPRRRRVRMLFIGNSHCFFWAVPESLAAMINAAPMGLHVEVDRCLRGGKDAGWLLKNTDAQQRIATGNYDYVVIQSMRMEQPGDEQHLRRSARAFARLAARAGSTLLMYCTWPRKGATRDAYRDQITRNYAIARAAEAGFVPAASAWERVRRERPGLRLHNSSPEDTVHSGMYGAFLAVCAFYSVLTGASAERHAHPALVAGQLRLPSAMARYLARVAWETVQRYAAMATPA